MKSAITKPSQVQCVPKKNGGVDYECPAGMHKCFVDDIPSANIQRDFVAAPTCPSSIFNGFCDRTDVAGGAACVFKDLLDKDGHLTDFITEPEQIQCVPKKNGGVNGGKYTCPAHMTKCIVDGPTPSHECPDAIFDGYCDLADIAGGAACIMNDQWQDGLIKSTITKSSQVQCVPTKNGGADYKCPAGMSKCLVGATPAVKPDESVVAPTTCPSSIFDGFCDPTNVAGGAACIFDGLLNEDGHLKKFITKPEQIQCVPKTNGGVNGDKYVCPAGMTKCIVDGPTPSHKCPSAIFDGFCDQGDIAGGAACIDNDHWQDGLIKHVISKPSQVQCIPIKNGGVDYECPAGMNKCYVGASPSANIQRKQEMTHHSMEIDLAEGGVDLWHGLNATGARYVTKDEYTVKPGWSYGAFQNPTTWQRYYNFKFTADNVYKMAGDTKSHFQIVITCDSAEHYEPSGCYVVHDQGHAYVAYDTLSFKCGSKFRFYVKNSGDRCGSQSGDIRFRKMRWEWDQVSS